MTRKMEIAALGLGICLLLGGCSAAPADDGDQTNLSVDIVVPYQTTTPIPDSAASELSQPFIIGANGDVSVNDTSWIDTGFAGQNQEEAEKYYTQLRLGDSGTEVRALQERLKELNYYQGEVSGVFDSATEDAVKLFELSYGTMQTGIATARLQTLLYLETAPVYQSNAYNTTQSGDYTSLQYGDTGQAVYALQRRLQELGYPVFETTGIFDEDTAEAVRQFYSAYDIEESVTASVAFQQELFSESARRNDSLMQITLSKGNVGSMVEEIQSVLIKLGYLEGEPSGEYDEETVNAVKALQQELSLEETGEISPSLRELLLNGNFASEEDLNNGIALNGTLKQGSQGEKVAKLQRRLIELGYPYVTVSAVYDDNTARAISIFEGIADLEETGTASRSLQEYLYSDDARIYRVTEELVSNAAGNAAANVVFSPGTTGTGVRNLNARLRELGYIEEAATNTYDVITEEAVKALQQAIGVEQTGVVTSTMLLYLNSSAVPTAGIRFYDEPPYAFERLQTGDVGEDVTRLQRRLWDIGALKTEGVENSIGVYNDATAEAVDTCQRAMGYQETDGIAGPEFQAFLFSGYADQLIEH